MPVPLPPRKKAPTLRGWQRLRLQERDLSHYFGREAGVGLLLGEPSQGLTDVDLDADEALRCGPAFLPPTNLRHGRTSKPGAHWFYQVAEELKTTRFKDVDGTCLVEVRNTGCQTVVPPSVHPSGEPLRWEERGEPALVERSTLLAAVSRVAACALLARHWPGEGSRHDCALALGGFLIRGGLDAEAAVQLVEIAAQTAGDEEAPNRASDVRSTAQAVAAGRPVTGRPTLATFLSDTVIRRLIRWLGLRSHTDYSTSPPPVDMTNSLPQAIRSVILDRRLEPFDKRRMVAALIEEELGACGQLYRTMDGRLLFFYHSDRRLYDLDQRVFHHLLTHRTGLTSSEIYHRFVLDRLRAHTSQEAPLARVHALASYDPTTGLVAVSNGAGGIWFRERSGSWQSGHNGDHGILFMTEPEATPFEPVFGDDGHILEWFLGRFCLADHPLSRCDQRALLQMWMFQQFFPRLRRTRMIPACLGPQGSGKTTAQRLIGRLLLGPEFDVSGIHRDREDAFVAAITNRVLYGLDNADSRVPWLEDALARYATGERYRMRRLYTTNDEVSYSPTAILMLSSRDVHFNRPDVAERLLPLHFERPATYLPEEPLFAELEARRGAVMGALLTRVGQIADALDTAQPPAMRFRMADFASFGWRVSAMVGQADEWVQLLARLERAQAQFASEGDGLIAALSIVLQQEGGAIQAMAVGELFRRCRTVAEDQNLLFPRSPQGFGRRLSNLRRVIEIELAVRIQEATGHNNTRLLTITPTTGGTGDDGGAVWEETAAGVPG